MIYGVQLFGISDLAKGDMDALGTALSEAGILQVEPFVALSPADGFEEMVWTMEECKENLLILKKYGIDADSVHIFSDDLARDRGQVIRLVREVPVVSTSRSISLVSVAAPLA